MQIQTMLDIRESTWELSREAQTHNKLLLTGTILLVFYFYQLISSLGFFLRAGEKNEEKKMLCKNKKLLHFCFF